MPPSLTYPGVYVVEKESGVRTITGVATSITAFIGSAEKGPAYNPTRIAGFEEYLRIFGRILPAHQMGNVVQQYYVNGGVDALIVRVHADDALEAAGGAGGVNFRGASAGVWANDHRIKVESAVIGGKTRFSIRFLQPAPAADKPEPPPLEQIFNLSGDENDPRFITSVLEQNSQFLRVVSGAENLSAGDGTLSGGNDGRAITAADIVGDAGQQTGFVYALEKADLFNLLCIAPLAPGTSISDNDTDVTSLLAPAVEYCQDRRAILLLDPKSDWDTVTKAVNGLSVLEGAGLRSRNAALYFPMIYAPDPSREGRPAPFVPCGAVAGVIARTDVTRGVWKAPAGVNDGVLRGIAALKPRLTDSENGQLNPKAVNCLRNFPIYGNVVWGARTMVGEDERGDEWKYLPVRRLALFLEESLYRGLKWVVFEPNDEPLWAQIRANVGAFMQNLFRQGAFQGQSADQAYFVKCGSETTTQYDINRGVVNILIGFAPLKPAEFVVLTIQQMAGQTAA